MTQRTWKRLFALVLTLALACGCFAISALATEKREITVAMSMNEVEWQVMRDVVFTAFEEATGIHVNGLQIEYADMESKVEALHAAGKAEIDVICPDNMLLAGLVSKGLVKDMTEYASIIPEEIPENLYNGFMFDGQLYYFPTRANAKIDYYNSAKFEEYGLELPTDWDSLLEVAKTFYEKEGIGRMSIQGNLAAPTTATMFEFITAAGGDVLVLNDEGSVAAYTFMQQLWPYLSAESKRANPNITNQILANETVYYADNWPVGATVIVKESGKTEVLAHPGVAGPNGMVKVLGGSVMAMTSISEKDEDVLAFMEYMMSLEAQKVFCGQIGWTPIRADSIEAIEEWQKPYFEAAMEAMQYTKARPNVTYWSDVDKAINGAFQEIVIDGNEDVQGVLDRYHEELAAAQERAAQ